MKRFLTQSPARGIITSRLMALGSRAGISVQSPPRFNMHELRFRRGLHIRATSISKDDYFNNICTVLISSSTRSKRPEMVSHYLPDDFHLIYMINQLHIGPLIELLILLYESHGSHHLSLVRLESLLRLRCGASGCSLQFRRVGKGSVRPP